MLKHLILLFLCKTFLPSVMPESNNLCKNFIDYYHPNNNPNCFYNPDMYLDTPEIIKKYARNVEIYQVTSEDGYILKMFRIPRRNPKGVILIHHSIATYSHIYLWQGNDSLALTLWKNGFDVWLANQRGTTYSNGHVKMTSHDFRYWDFSFHEMGIYDVSSELELIRTKTNNSKVIFMGHSLGSGVGLVYASMKPIEAENYLKSMVLLATPCYFKHATSGIVLFKRFSSIFKALMDFLQIGSPLQILPILIPISRLVLRFLPVILVVTSVFVWIFCGYTPNETDPTFFNFDAIANANDFSWKTLDHFFQISKTNRRFQMYDYGKEKNMKIYKQELPPLYPLNHTIPTLMVSSYNDSLTSLKDAEFLFNQLPSAAKIYGHWKIAGLNHLDYLTGLHRRDIFVDELVKFLKKL